MWTLRRPTESDLVNEPSTGGQAFNVLLFEKQPNLGVTVNIFVIFFFWGAFMTLRCAWNNRLKRVQKPIDPESHPNLAAYIRGVDRGPGFFYWVGLVALAFGGVGLHLTWIFC